LTPPPIGVTYPPRACIEATAGVELPVAKQPHFHSARLAKVAQFAADLATGFLDRPEALGGLGRPDGHAGLSTLLGLSGAGRLANSSCSDADSRRQANAYNCGEGQAAADQDFGTPRSRLPYRAK